MAVADEAALGVEVVEVAMVVDEAVEHSRRARGRMVVGVLVAAVFGMDAVVEAAEAADPVEEAAGAVEVEDMVSADGPEWPRWQWRR